MLYIFCGNDFTTINKQYIKLITAQKLITQQFDTVEELCPHLYQTDLLNSKKAYCVRYDKKFLTAEDAWEPFINHCKDKIVILIYEELDKRSKFYKFFLDFIIDFREKEETIVFDFARFICQKRLSEALQLSYQINTSDYMYALNVLYNKVRKILQIQTTPKDVKLSVNTGLQDKEYYVQRNCLNIYSNRQLENILMTVSSIIEEIKTGDMPIESTLKFLIIQIFVDIL